MERTGHTCDKCVRKRKGKNTVQHLCLFVFLKQPLDFITKLISGDQMKIPDIARPVAVSEFMSWDILFLQWRYTHETSHMSLFSEIMSQQTRKTLA